MLRLEVKHLRMVSAVAELGNLTRAAQLLCVSQPALSKQLGELEERLGFALFHRTRKAMRLTDPGSTVHVHARKILGDMAALEAELKQYGKGTTGKLTLSIDRVHHAGWLPAVMSQFRALHQGIELKVGQVPNLLASVQLNESDIAIVGEAVPAPGIAYIALHDDEIVAVLPLSHPLCGKDYVEAHDLEGVDMAYYFELEQSYLYRRHLYPGRISLGSFHHIQDIDAVIGLVKSGAAMSILPRRLVRDAVAGGTLAVRPISQDGYAFTWYAAWRPASDKPYVAQFAALLKSALSGQ